MKRYRLFCLATALGLLWMAFVTPSANGQLRLLRASALRQATVNQAQADQAQVLVPTLAQPLTVQQSQAANAPTLQPILSMPVAQAQQLPTFQKPLSVQAVHAAQIPGLNKPANVWQPASGLPTFKNPTLFKPPVQLDPSLQPAKPTLKPPFGVLKPNNPLPNPVTPDLYIRVIAPLGLSSALGGQIPGGQLIPDIEKPVPGAMVAIFNNAANRFLAMGPTDADGLYSATLQPGTYEIYVTKSGFVKSITPLALGKTSMKKTITIEPIPGSTGQMIPVPPIQSLPRLPFPRRPLQRQPLPPLGSQPEPPETATIPSISASQAAVASGNSASDLVEKAPGIDLLSPNGGETLVPGRVHEIRWIEEENVSLPFIFVMRGDTTIRVYDSSEIYGTRTSAGWHWSWTVPHDLPPGDDYRIRLEATATPEDSSEPPYTVSDTSDDEFTIAGRGITIRGPRAGESVYITRSEFLSWTSAGVAGNLRILLCPEGTESAVQVLKESVPASDRGRWTVGVGEGRGATSRIEPGRYYIRAMSIEDHTLHHDTPVFTIAAPDVRVTAPIDPGYTLRGDEPQTIRWTLGHMAGSVDIELWTRDVRLATVARDVPAGAFSHTSTWFPDPEGVATGSITETLRDVRVRLVSTSVPWLYIDGDDRFDVYYD